MTIALLALAAPIALTAAAGAAPSDDISAVLDDWHAAAAKADEARYFAHFAAQAVFLGTDAAERWTLEEFKAYAHPHFAKGKAWTLVPNGRHVSFSPDGNTAWFDERVDNAGYGQSRGTGVLLKTKDGWKIAQYNLTVPIPNEMLLETAGRIRRRAEARFEKIAPPEAKALIDRHKGQEDFAVIDVRTPEERSRARIAGSVNLDFSAKDFDERLKALERDRAYLVHCAVGGRSAAAAGKMKDLGFREVYDLQGGLNAWQSAGLPVEKDTP